LTLFDIIITLVFGQQVTFLFGCMQFSSICIMWMKRECD